MWSVMEQVLASLCAAIGRCLFISIDSDSKETLPLEDLHHPNKWHLGDSLTS